MEGWREGDDFCLGNAGSERGRDGVGCLVENTELDLTLKYLDLGLHLPCENTRAKPIGEFELKKHITGHHSGSLSLVVLGICCMI